LRCILVFNNYRYQKIKEIKTMSKIKNMGAATVRFNEGVIIDGTAGNDSYALITTGSIYCSSDGYFDRIYLGGGDGTGSTISNGNTDTYIQMYGSDVINMVAGNKNFLQIVETNTNSRIIINENALNIDFRVETMNRAYSIFSDASNDVIYLGGYPANEPAGSDVGVYISGSYDRKLVINAEVVITGGVSFSGPESGLILSSPNGTMFALTIDDDGSVGSFQLTP